MHSTNTKSASNKNNMAITKNDYGSWAQLKPSLDSLIEQKTQLHHNLLTLPLSTSEFAQTQQTLATVKKNIPLAQESLPHPTSIQQEKIANSEIILEDLLSVNHKRFLSYYHSQDHIPPLLTNWHTTTPSQEKQQLLQEITTACQLYLQTSHFEQTILPTPYNLNTLYCELAYLANDNHLLLQDYTKLDSQETITNFSTTRLTAELKQRTKYATQLKNIYKHRISAAESQLIDELTTTLIKNILKETQQIIQNPKAYFKQRETIEQACTSIQQQIEKINNQPQEPTVAYIQLLLTPLPKKIIVESDKNTLNTNSLYLTTISQKNHTHLTTLNQVIDQQQQTLLPKIQQRTKTIEEKLSCTEKDIFTAAQLQIYQQEISSYIAYATHFNHKDLITDSHFLKQKITRLLSYYITSNQNNNHSQAAPSQTTPMIPKIPTIPTQAITQLSSSPDTIIENNTLSITPLPLPELHNFQELLRYTTKLSRTQNNPELTKYCHAILGYTPQHQHLSYSPHPLHTRIHQTTIDQTKMDKRTIKLYEHLAANLKKYIKA